MALIGEITWYRGDSYPFELTVKDATTSTAIDITGYSFIFTVNSEQHPIDNTTEEFNVDGVLDADPATGKVTFTPTALNTDLEPATYYYDIQMIDGSSNIRTIAKNKFMIVQDITK